MKPALKKKLIDMGVEISTANKGVAALTADTLVDLRETLPHLLFSSLGTSPEPIFQKLFDTLGLGDLVEHLLKPAAKSKAVKLGMGPANANKFVEACSGSKSEQGMSDLKALALASATDEPAAVTEAFLNACEVGGVGDPIDIFVRPVLVKTLQPLGVPRTRHCRQPRKLTRTYLKATEMLSPCCSFKVVQTYPR